MLILGLDIKQNIIGVAVGGDLVRGDFIPNNSGILVFPLFSNRTSLFLYETQAYRIVTDIFDKQFKPYFDCTESPSVWDNFSTDEIHLPDSAESFDPPTIPQPHWYSMYLFDLIDHHHVIYGEDFIKNLYRPDPRRQTVRAASEVLRVVRSGVKVRSRPQVGFGTHIHWQVLKMVRLLQLHFSDDKPTLLKPKVLSNSEKYVPEFQLKIFGICQWKKMTAERYPVDRKEYSETHSAKRIKFIDESCDLILKYRTC